MVTCAMLSTWYNRNSERVARRMVNRIGKLDIQAKSNAREGTPARSHFQRNKKTALTGAGSGAVWRSGVENTTECTRLQYRASQR